MTEMLPLLYLLVVSLSVALVTVWWSRGRSVPGAVVLSTAGAALGGMAGLAGGIVIETLTAGQVSVAHVSGAVAAIVGATLASLAPELVS